MPVLRNLLIVAVAVAAAACGAAPPPDLPAPEARPLPPPLPDETGWGVHVLSITGAPGGAFWIGTLGDGIFTIGDPRAGWRALDAATGAAPIASDLVSAVAAQADSVIWYGTIGSGFGVSRDRGETWRNWTGDALGDRWRFVALNGIRTRGDTVYIATGDGIRISWDGGSTWRCVGGRDDDLTATPPDDCSERVAGLASPYVLALAVGPTGAIWAGHLAGLSVSRDAGRSWQDVALPAATTASRVRAVAIDRDSSLWVATEAEILTDPAARGELSSADIRVLGWPGLPGAPRAIIATPGMLGPAIATSFGLAAAEGPGQYRVYYLATGEMYRPAADIWSMAWWGPPLWPIAAASAGLNRVLAGESALPAVPRAAGTDRPEAPRRAWLARPIATDDGNPFIDATFRHGAARAAAFGRARGVALNNPAGTPVRAIAAGRVVFAGTAADGSLRVAVLHGAPADGRSVFSTYDHNGTLAVAEGDAVSAGQVIARVGRTGPAINAHLRLQVHAAPAPDPAPVAQPATSPFAVNPQLWLEPLPGTGVVAGRVLDAAGAPIAGARLFGFVLPYPHETPFSFIETYADGMPSDPLYQENFALGDVPAGDYLVGVDIDGRRVWRRIVVAAGQITFAEFAP